MTETLMAIEINCETGEEVVRPFTSQEIADRNEMIAASEEKAANEAIEIQRINTLKQSAKSKLISGQPLTQEEADVLVI
jgi:hypothetical protein